MASSSSKLAVTATAKDEVSKDLRAVAKSFEDTAKAADSANKGTAESGDAAAGALTRLGTAGKVAGAVVAGVAAAAVLATAALGAAAVVAFSLTTASASLGDAAFVAGQRIGVSTEALTRWEFAARQSGAGAGSVEKAFLTLSKNAATGSTQFKKWGVELTDSNGALRSSEELFEAAAQKVGAIENPVLRAAAAQDLFGRAGKELIPLLKLGEEGIEALGAKADRLGISISSAESIVANQFNNQLGAMGDATQAVARSMGGVFQPSLTKAFEAVQNVAGIFFEQIEKNRKGLTTFATKTVALAARGFALLTEAAIGASHALEAVVSVFTFRLEGAFIQARGLAGEVATEARLLAGELSRGAEVTRDEVVPAVESETGARGELVETLKREKKARVDVREAAGEVIADLLTIQDRARETGVAQDEGVQVALGAIAKQLDAIDQWQTKLAGLGRATNVFNESIRRGATIEQALAGQKVAEDRVREAILRRIAVAKQSLRVATEAAGELVTIKSKEADAAEEAAERTLKVEEEFARASEAIERDHERLRQAGRQREEAADAERLRKIQSDAAQTARDIESVGMSVASSIRSNLAEVAAGTESLGDAMADVGERIVDIALDMAISFAVAKTAALVAQAIGVTAASVDVGVSRGAAASQISHQAGIAGASAIAAYAGIPFLGPVLGAAAAGKAIGAVMANMGFLAFAQGGFVPGFGRSDTVPAMLTPGELVVQREVAEAVLERPSGGGGDIIQHFHLPAPVRSADMEIWERRNLRPSLRRNGFGRSGIGRG